eukprot:1151813-Pelagomonas_calceolata.AAC.6
MAFGWHYLCVTALQQQRQQQLLAQKQRLAAKGLLGRGSQVRRGAMNTKCTNAPLKHICLRKPTATWTRAG